MDFRVAKFARRRRGSCFHADSGFTLIEMITTMAIAGVLMAIAAWSLHAYSDAQAEKGTANKVLGSLRDTAQRAQAEGRAYCVSFDSATSWSVWRYSCTSWTGVSLQGAAIHNAEVSSASAEGKAVLDSVSFSAPASAGGFADACPAGSLGCVYFLPRGNSSYGHLDVARPGTSRTYTITVEGLTSRAYLG